MLTKNAQGPTGADGESQRATTLGVVPTWVPKDAPLAIKMAAAATHDPPEGARQAISARDLESCAAAAERAGNRRDALWLLALAANQRRLELMAPERGYVVPTVARLLAWSPEATSTATPKRTTAKRKRGSNHSLAPSPLDPTLPAWARDVLYSLPPILTRAEAARELTLSERKLDLLIAARVIPAVHQGTRVTIPRLGVVLYLVARAGARPL